MEFPEPLGIKNQGSALISDHSGSLIHIDKIGVTDSPPNWIFRPHAPPTPNEQPLPNDLWKQVATTGDAWRELIKQGDIHAVWKAWSADAERCLRQNGSIQSGSHFQPRGTTPRLWSGASWLSSGQTLRERQLRRLLRRVQEIQLLFRNGRIPDPAVIRKAKAGCVRMGHVVPTHDTLWGEVSRQIRADLDAHLNKKHTEAISKWRQSVTTIPGACAWLRKKPPPAWTLTQDGHVTTGRSAGAALLHRTWAPIFNGPANYSPNTEGFMTAYEEWLPQLETLETQPLDIKELQQTLRGMRKKAAGPDGWAADQLLLLPEGAHERLIEVLTFITGGWPSFQRTLVTQAPRLPKRLDQ